MADSTSTAGAGTLAPPTQAEWLENPTLATQRYTDYLHQTQVLPALRAAALQTAATNKRLVQMQRQDEFRRWGPEIEATLEKMAPDPTSWTPDNMNSVVDVVKARHVNELIAEERAQYSNELGGFSMRPSAPRSAPSRGPISGGNIDLDKLPPGYGDALKALAVDQRTIDEFLTRTYCKSGMEPDLNAARARWIQQVQRGDVFSDNRTLESKVF